MTRRGIGLFVIDQKDVLCYHRLKNVDDVTGPNNEEIRRVGRKGDDGISITRLKCGLEIQISTSYADKRLSSIEFEKPFLDS